MGMKYFWAMLNWVLIAAALRVGYVSLTPDRLRHTNPGPTPCLAILIMMPVFAIGTVSYSIRRWNAAPLPRPSWSRNPFNGWRDPLQGLFILTCIAAATALGSALRRPTFGSVGFWTLGVYVSFVIGLFAGQVLVYRIYRQCIGTN